MTSRTPSILSRFPVILGSQSSTRRAMVMEVMTQGPCTTPTAPTAAATAAASSPSMIHIIPPKIDEAAIGNRHAGASSARELVLELGHAKADRILEIIANRKAAMIEANNSNHNSSDSSSNSATSSSSSPEDFDDAIIITGDQVVTCRGDILEKPSDKGEAKHFYSHYYSNHTCNTIGSIVVTHVRTKQRVAAVDIGTITFATIPAEVINAVVDNDEENEENEALMYCCGGLMIEHTVLGKYILKLEGGEDAVLGLRKETLCKLAGELEDKVQGAGGQQ